MSPLSKYAQHCPNIWIWLCLINKLVYTPIENKRDQACSSTPSNAGNAPEEGKKRANRGN